MFNGTKRKKVRQGEVEKTKGGGREEGRRWNKRVEEVEEEREEEKVEEERVEEEEKEEVVLTGFRGVRH